MRSLILLLDGAAPSFCYYRSPPAGTERAPMDRPTLARAVAYAAERELPLQVVAGAQGVSAEQRALLGEHPHVCYAPISAETLAPGDVPVVTIADRERVARLAPGRHPIAILRVGRAGQGSWVALWRELSPRVQRVVLVLLELERYGCADLEAYAAQLAQASATLEQAYLAGEAPELSVLSDRMALRAPNECGAGVEHVTVDPAGQLHICPGFVGQTDYAAGALPDAPRIANGRLLLRERAPICALCDAFHCRRCVLLNQRATLELNTPPWQLCRAAHLEREAARQLLARLHRQRRMTGLASFDPVPYADPFERLTGRRMCDGELTAVDPKIATDR